MLNYRISAARCLPGVARGSRKARTALSQEQELRYKTQAALTSSEKQREEEVRMVRMYVHSLPPTRIFHGNAELCTTNRVEIVALQQPCLNADETRRLPPTKSDVLSHTFAEMRRP